MSIPTAVDLARELHGIRTEQEHTEWRAFVADVAEKRTVNPDTIETYVSCFKRTYDELDAAIDEYHAIRRQIEQAEQAPALDAAASEALKRRTEAKAEAKRLRAEADRIERDADSAHSLARSAFVDASAAFTQLLRTVGGLPAQQFMSAVAEHDRARRRLDAARQARKLTRREVEQDYARKVREYPDAHPSQLAHFEAVRAEHLQLVEDAERLPELEGELAQAAERVEAARVALLNTWKLEVTS